MDSGAVEAGLTTTGAADNRDAEVGVICKLTGAKEPEELGAVLTGTTLT
jgi:hypothetical protein